MSSEADAPRLELPDGTSLAYHALPGASPAVVFLGGFASDMTGTKAIALEAHCRMSGRAYVRFDYFGHGASDGRFEEATIGRWLSDALAVIDRLTEGPVVLVGSSMGGWLAVLAALVRTDRVAGLVGVAAAPDFTEDLIRPGLTDAARRELAEKGVVFLPNPYGEAPTPIRRELLDEARRHRVLQGPIPLACPVRLLHGMADSDVPWQTSARLAEALESRDVVVTLQKEGEHRLSDERGLAWLFGAVDELCEFMSLEDLPQRRDP
jgi:pimeloyl-ACP methyl ester carboxylesterase